MSMVYEKAIPLVATLALLAALLIYLAIKKKSPGSAKMVEISDQIHGGAMAFLRREYGVIVLFCSAAFLVIANTLGMGTALAYMAGAFCSALAGYFGMKAATSSNSRATQAAIDGGTPAALDVAFRGGSVMGISVAALGLLGLSVTYLLTKDPYIINGFAMGASSVALFARVGGGIYTKSADVGADLAGKLEEHIPEDDPRNPGVIADNVGDCVGDTAGMGADLFESYVGSVVAAMAIGATLASPGKSMFLPLALITAGLLSSLAGLYSMKLFNRIDPQAALRYVTYVSAALFLAGSFLLIKNISGETVLFWPVLIGMLAGALIGLESEFFTSGPPVKAVARSSISGAATNILSGLATGFVSTALPIITIALATYISHHMAGIYGIALSAVSMLSTIGIVMSIDSYGPIADNAGGIAQMSGQSDEVRKITDGLDAIGNTTAAIGKGFAIGSAALTALALLSAYEKIAGVNIINLTNVTTIVGLFIGALMPFIITSFALKAVSRTAGKIIAEIRRQFAEISGLREGTARPDATNCVDIATKGSLKEMAIPGLLSLVMPLFVGFAIGKQALGGFLAGSLICGTLLGIMMTTVGAVWDNAKKWIEEGNLGGKGTPAHDAAVVGDTVGDPFKDTAGPAMNILIKLMAIVALVFAPLM